MAFQNNVLKTGIGHLMTLDDLKTSRNIKIPFTIARNKIITNLVDILLKNYPDEVRPIITFSFEVDPDSKKLSINETRELTVLISNDDMNKLQGERNEVSCDHFLTLISQFRLFNLTKLLKKTRERALLSQVIKLELGKTVFTYKHFSMNKQSMEIAEDYCFHHDNYDSVRKTMTLEKINKVIANHSAPILRRLKNFGILNTEFSDYTDTKLDYLLNILLQDLYLSLSDSELTEVKNFNSLRSCILKVETLIDPIITAGNDIVAYIRENSICAASAVSSVFNQLAEERLLSWVEENGPRQKIIQFRDEDAIIYLIDGAFLLPRLTELHDLILEKPDVLMEMSHSEREKIFDEMNLLCNAGRNLLLSDDNARAVLDKDESMKKMHRIIDEYDNYQNSYFKETAVDREERAARKRRSLIEAISDFFMSLFAPKKDEPISGAIERDSLSENETEQYRPLARGEAKSIVFKIKNSNAKLIVLSNYIDLLPANEADIEIIINDIRKLNLKIVIPIYNARKVLYPIRSQQYLIPDMEYLMVNPDIIQSPEGIREFADSLAGEKVKDEKITGQAILNIEKYLMSIYSQKKAQMIRKAKAKK
ncbi:MAG: hypothetical protein KA369_12130 [Spirochaetes bacterium]|nr:hypothetical protein [Spirochaetota bacterium]